MEPFSNITAGHLEQIILFEFLENHTFQFDKLQIKTTI